MTTQYDRQTERVNLLDDSDSENEIKIEAQRNQQFWPRDLANASHAETGMIDEEGKAVNCVASANQSIRIAFLRKVLGIVSFQILFTIGICTAIYKIPNSKTFLVNNSWVVFPNLFGSIALIIALHVKSREVPLNYVLLVAFTAMQAFTLGCFVSMFEAKVILEASIITGIVVAGLFLFTLQNKRDFSSGYAMAGSLMGVLFMSLLFQMFTMSPVFNLAVNVFGAGIFCVLLVIDLDMVMYRFSPEEYICACAALYLDVINLFIRILQIVAEANK